MSVRAKLFEVRGRAEEGKEKDGDQDDSNILAVERPRSWGECVKLLWNLNDRKFFQFSNPDGYFYLTFLKKAAFLFTACKCFFANLCSELAIAWPLRSFVLPDYEPRG